MKNKKIAKKKILDKWYVIVTVSLLIIWFAISFTLLKNIDDMIFMVFNISVVFAVPLIVLFARIILARIDAEEKYIEILGVTTSQLGIPIDNKKQKKLDVFKEYFTELKKSFIKTSFVKKIVFLLGIILYLLTCIVCIMFVPNKDIPTWFFPLITHNIAGYVKSVPQYGFYILIVVFIYNIIKAFTLDMDKKYSNVIVWILFIMVICPFTIRLIYEGGLVALCVVAVLSLIFYLIVFLINKRLSKHGRRLPGGLYIKE